MTLPELVESLVAIPSHDDPTAAGDFIEDWLRTETDATIGRDAVGNVLARRGNRPDALALVGHHDVVPPTPDQVSQGGYVTEQRGGRIYGRGSADMKGSLAAAMRAFRDAEPAMGLTFASLVDEEVGGRGADHAIEQGFVPDAAVILEGSTGYSADGVVDVAIAHNGRRESRLIASGSSAHASEPAAGENAIYRACSAIEQLRTFEWPTTMVAEEHMRGSVVATKIEGGDRANVIPDRCTVWVDERTVPDGRVPIETLAELEGITVEIDQDLPPMRCRDAMFAGEALAVADACQPARPRHVTKPHATDGGRLDRAGTACVVIGGAEPGEAHTDDESVSIDVLERCERIYRDLAARWNA